MAQRCSWWEHTYGSEAPQPLRLNAKSATPEPRSQSSQQSVFQAGTQPAPFTRMVLSPSRHFTPARTHQHLTTGPLQTSLDVSRAQPTVFHFETFDPHNKKRKRKGRDALAPEGSPDPKRSWPTANTTPTSPRGTRPVRGGEPVLSRPTRLRIDRSVQAPIYEDIWMEILMNCPLRFLFTAENINQWFRGQLQKFEHVWKNCRVRTYGEDMPGPPDISERQYADLVDGRGCMNPSCAKADTVKTYWAYRARWCEDCMKRRVVNEKYVRERQIEPSEPPRLLECIPAALFAGGKYKGTKRSAPDAWAGAGHTMFVAEDVANIKAEFKVLVESGASVEAQTAWIDSRSSAMTELSNKIRDIEAWEKRKALEAPKFRTARFDFFSKKAGDLDTPITTNVLDRMTSFCMALDSNRAPNDAQWTVLLPKLLSERPEAERLARISQAEQDYQNGANPTEIDLYRNLHLHRNQESSPEQRFAMDMARRSLEVVAQQSVADTDFVLLVLRHVHRTYSELKAFEKPMGVCMDGKRHLYELTLDDAKMIVEKVIIPHIDTWGVITRMVAAKERFKCSACQRKDCVTRYSFEAAFGHINAKHSRRTGEYSRLRRAIAHPPDHVFPWYTVPWPRNLPILPDHHSLERGYRWDPDDTADYVEAPRAGTESAFDGRCPTGVLNLAPEDFTGNLKFVAGKLLATRLEPDYQTKVALEFALRRYATSYEKAHPPMTAILHAYNALLDTQNRNVLNRLRCRKCVMDVHCPRTAKFVKSPQPFIELYEHFQAKHIELPWVQNMLHLPSDTEVKDALESDDEQLKAAKSAVTKNEEARRNVARKKPSKKTDVILKTQSSLEVFRELFVEEEQIDPALTADQ